MGRRVKSQSHASSQAEPPMAMKLRVRTPAVGRAPGAGPWRAWPTRVVEVPGGIRLAQGPVVLSELRLMPGPTHSVFDVLGALIHRLAPSGHVAVLGFAAGGLVAPLHALGGPRRMEGVDLDPAGHALFCRWCPEWARDVDWFRADAARWLGSRRRRYTGLVEDLSEPRAGDVHKPAACRVRMPRLIRRRLASGGVAVFNLVPDEDGSWPGLAEAGRLFGGLLEVRYDGYLNRTVVAGDALPAPAVLGRWLQADLGRMGSRLAGRTWVARVVAGRRPSRGVR